MLAYLTERFFLLWLLPLLGAGVAAWVSYVSRNAAIRRGLSREGYLHCGKCLYIVQGIGSSNCPECGSHQTAVGLRTVTDFAPLAFGYRMIIWMQFLTGPAYIGTLLILYLIPIGCRCRSRL